VSDLPDTSTMLASPESLRCVSLLMLAIIEDASPKGAGCR
jgi:hypothetical protein